MKEKYITNEELAEDVFLKTEHVQALESRNVAGLEYEERKKAFIELAIARNELTEAKMRLDFVMARRAQGF
jgi:hypothetical protein